MKKLIGIMVMMLVLLFSTACGMFSNSASNDSEKEGSADTDSKVVKIGFVLAETGPASTLGKAEVNTAKLLQKELEAKGEINGTKVELLIRDYESDDTKAVIAMDKLVADGVSVVIGATQASTTNAILPKASQAQVPLMTVAPIETDAENVFVMTHSNQTVTSALVDYFKENNITKVAWINARDAFGVSGLPAFEPQAKENNIEIVAHEEFDATATDMTIQLTNIRKKNPEALVIWSRTPGAGVVARNFKALGMDIPVLQSHAAANDGFVEQVKSDSSNMYVVASKLSVVDQLPDSEEKSKLAAYRDAYVAQFNEQPDLYGGYTYDAIQIVLEAIEVGKTSSADIAAYFKESVTDYKGVSGPYNLSNPMDGALAEGISLLGIENGQWKYTE